MLEVLQSEYVVTARSKGIGAGRIFSKHVLRNSATSAVVVLGVNVAWLIGGTVVVEEVFALNGIGKLMVDGIFQRDFPIVQGVTFVFAILVVLVYLATDVVHSLLDPKVRTEGQ
jgi:peptide/nickel transport system permease protein